MAFSIYFYHLEPIAALIAGILILVMPRLLNYIVALYLIVIGIYRIGSLGISNQSFLQKGRWNGLMREKAQERVKETMEKVEKGVTKSGMSGKTMKKRK